MAPYRNAKSVIRREIKLPDLGIAEVRPRRVVTGAFIFEIAGQDANSKASRLAWAAGDEATVAYLYDAYHDARRPLHRAIKEAKRQA
jgi:hypothetical protein